MIRLFLHYLRRKYPVRVAYKLARNRYLEAR